MAASTPAPSTDHSLARAVARRLQDALPEGVLLSVDELAELLTAPPNPALGDLAFPCFRLAKALRKGPPMIAGELARRLAELSDAAPIAEATAAGPYVNLRLDLGAAAAIVLPGSARGERPHHAAGERVMVEFSQPNTHKAFHVGHMRNLCLGDAIVRLLRADGNQVIAANYFGDVGAHIAKCLWWYLDRLSDAERQPPASHRGEWLGQIYTRAHNQLEEWQEQAAAGDAAAADLLAAAKARTTAILRGLEARDPELVAIWDETRHWSLADFAEIYGWCGVTFDHLFYESEVDEEGLRLVEDYLQRGIFVESQGAIGIFNEEIKHMPFFLLRKQDGTSLYSTKDLALARLKFEKFQIDRSIYVVDVRQSDHFRHVFLTLKKMGFGQAERCQHVGYEMVELPEGPMSGRKGTVILFRALREAMTSHVVDNYLAKFRGEWSDAEIDDTARMVALGAIKYGMLARDVQQKIVFDMSAWLDLEGNTGPYLQYTHARATSILRKCAEVDKELDPALLEDPAAARAATAALVEPQERELVLLLDQRWPVAHQAAQSLRPSVLCTYLYNLAKAFNRFNQACPVKPSEGALLQARLLLVRATIGALAQGLDLLGIPAPDRM
ncbi:MAG: arginine--tRNA ligase [Myxococcales bacterium]|nr:arginine--tRNA ligase [Myxococcales bacterium]